MNEQGIMDFKKLVKELQKTNKIAANKSIVTEIVFAKNSKRKIQQPVLLKKSQHPNIAKQSEEQLKQSENELELSAPVSNSQPKQ